MSIIIGQGESKTLFYNITDKDEIFSNEDTLLFALKSVDGTVVYLEEEEVGNLPVENSKYVFKLELSSNLTNTFTIGKERYFFDLTLIKDQKKIPLTNVKSVDVIKTVGASIGEV